MNEDSLQAVNLVLNGVSTPGKTIDAEETLLDMRIRVIFHSYRLLQSLFGKSWRIFLITRREEEEEEEEEPGGGGGTRAASWACPGSRNILRTVTPPLSFSTEIITHVITRE